MALGVDAIQSAADLEGLDPFLPEFRTDVATRGCLYPVPLMPGTY